MNRRMIPRRQHLPSGRLLPLFLDSSDDVDRYADEMGMRRDEAWRLVRRGEIILRCTAKEPEVMHRHDGVDIIFAGVVGFLLGSIAALLANNLLS